MKPRDVLAPIAVGTATGLIGMATAVGGLAAYEWDQERRAAADRAEVQQDTQEEVNTYFSGMEHVDVDANVNKYGRLTDLTIELVLEALDGPEAQIAEKLRSASVKIDGTIVTNDGPVGASGSGFFIQDGTGNIRLLTAGHLIYNMYPDTISVYSGDADRFHRVEVNEFDTRFVDSDGYTKEDIAVGTLANPERYRDVALKARNLETNPLRPGEQLHLTNFQRGREIGDEISYTMIYLREVSKTNGRFILALGDVMQNRAEDELQPGGSGGVITDDFGEIVGITVASTAVQEDPAYECGQDILVLTAEGIFGHKDDIIPRLRVPSSNDECYKGMSLGTIRTIGEFATSDPIG